MNKPKKLSAICIGATALALHIKQELPPKPNIRPVWSYAQDDRVLPPVELSRALVSEKTAKVEPISIPPAEIDFEPPKPSDRPTILTSKEQPRNNPIPELSSIQHQVGNWLSSHKWETLVSWTDNSKSTSSVSVGLRTAMNRMSVSCRRRG